MPDWSIASVLNGTMRAGSTRPTAHSPPSSPIRSSITFPNLGTSSPKWSAWSPPAAFCSSAIWPGRNPANGSINLFETYAGEASVAARCLFADSLNAALTLEEIRQLLRDLAISPETAAMTSDRHWTVSWTRSN